MPGPGWDGRRGPAPVLVVDDDENSRRLTSAALSSAGFDVVVAASGADAFEILGRTRCAVVILDHRMPGLSGVDVVSLIRQDPSTITLPVIFLSAADEVEDRVRGLAAGASDYVLKPFDPDELVARVRAQVRGHDVWAARLDHRASTVRRLWALPTSGSPERDAAAICAEILATGDLDGAAIVGLEDSGEWRSLAGAGDWSFVANTTADEGVARYLRRRLRGGAWIEQPQIAPMGTGPHVIALAPIRGLSGPGALLALSRSVLAVEPADPRYYDDLLAEAIDFAGVAGGILGLSLARGPDLDLRRAEILSTLSDRAFRPAFQPIAELASGQVIGFEALTRFTDGTPPADRFADAAMVGLGLDLELATMAAALDQAQHLPAGCFVSVNVSPALMGGAARQLRSLLSGRPRDIILELTEHEVIDDYDALRSTLAELGPLVRLSVDDAGAGFASLRHVLVLHPDFVKLDRSWVTDIESDATRQALVAGLAHFARATGCRLIAEGIETESERDALEALEVELGQGYLLGRPAVLDRPEDAVRLQP